MKIIDEFLNGDKIDKIFKTSLRNLLEILTPKRGDTNKNRWYKTKWWEKFLEYDETIDFSLAERDVMLGDLLEWLRVAVLPSLSLLEIIGNERGFDIYDLLQKAEKSTDFSKKQNRLYVNSQTLSDETINHYLSEFLGVANNGYNLQKNAQNVYKVSFYSQYWMWWALVLTLAVLSLVLGLVVSIKLVQVALWSLVAILTIWRAYSLTKSVIKAKTIGKYITQKKAEKAVTKSLLATMSVNRLQDTPFISVPSVTVCDSRPSHIT